MMSAYQAGGTIFSLREDIYAFLLPLLAALTFVAGWMTFTDFEVRAPPFWLLAVFFLLVDIPHVYTTVFRTYLDPEERQQRKRLLVLAPLFILIASWSLASYSLGYFAIFLVAAAIFHFIRQQFGWMMWSTYAGEESVLDKRINSVTIYTLTLFPLMYTLSVGEGMFWFEPGDLPTILPGAVAETGHYFYWLVVTAFVARQLYLIRAEKVLAYTKYMVFLSTAITWYVPLVVFNDPVFYFMLVALQALVHGVPYMLLTYKYARVRARQSRFPSWILSNHGVLLSYLVFLGFGLAEFVCHEEFLIEQLFSGEVPTNVVTALLVAFALPQLTHYFLDGFIWRGGPKLLSE